MVFKTCSVFCKVTKKQDLQIKCCIRFSHIHKFKKTLAVYILFSISKSFRCSTNNDMGLLIQQSSVRHVFVVLVILTLAVITLGTGFLRSIRPKSAQSQTILQNDLRDKLQTDFQPQIQPEIQQNSVILYNRIPKTGSTTLANIFNGLTTKNKFWAVNINSSYPSGSFGNAAVWPAGEQREFLINITTSKIYKKAIYHGHFGFISPERWQVPNANQITYINLIRNPLDRLLSYYYFVRNGDNFRKGLKRGHAADKRSINECVAETLGDTPEKKSNRKFNEDCSVKTIWKQVPMFCGQFTRCNDPSSREWAYNQAVQNLYKRYSVVGYTEKYFQFIELLEDTFPSFFWKQCRIHRR